MTTFLKQHTLFSLYLFIFLVLTFGVFVTSGEQHFDKLILYFISFVLFYILFFKTIAKIKFKVFNFKPLVKPNYLILVSILLIGGHFIQLGNIPILKAITIDNANDIAWIRTNIDKDTSLFFNYSSSLLIRAILPFVMLFVIAKQKVKLFIVLSLVYSFYAFALMQKSFIVTIFIPSIIYLIFNKKMILIAYSFTLVIFTVLTIGYVANPHLNPIKKKEAAVKSKNQISLNKNKKSSIRLLFGGLVKRVSVTPGEIVSKWFETVPEKVPYAGLDGYRFIAKLRGRTHLEYSKELYPIISKKYYDRGLRGSVNTASFVYEYANFGYLGLVLSAFFLALILVSVELLFKNDFVLKVALNFYPIIILSSSAITTLLISGGWIITLVLYYQMPIKLNNEK